MNTKNMTQEEIDEFNEKVAYYESAGSWVVDIICAIIFFPTIILAIIRRLKYSERIEQNNNNEQNNK